MVKSELTGTVEHPGLEIKNVMVPDVTSGQKSIEVYSFTVKSTDNQFVKCNYWGEPTPWLLKKLSGIQGGMQVKVMGKCKASSYISKKTGLVVQQLTITITDLDFINNENK